ncbi:N-acetyl-glucosamine-6-phosphate deacetylase [Scheffersomyces coipomensis]|uniref:N-acetyl-glucosamine-6-phosphate deacetylase n=1 Tax=Scheffersomyces coipomensis TaxID=1788519 RepID=UPI00315DDB9D
MSTYTKFTNCNLIDNGKVYKSTDLYINNQTKKIAHPPHNKKLITNTIDLQGNYLAPGFLDIQNNGIYGLNYSNLNENSNENDIRMFKSFYNDAMQKYLTTGVTGVCPTVTSNFPAVYKKVLPFYKKSRLSNQSDSLGAHLEGPFISLKKKGCHPTETFVDAQTSDLFEVYGGEENIIENVCIITAAPEIPGVLETIPHLIEKGIIFSIGHTMSDYQTGVKAVQNGASMITHLYNAMPQPHHRDVGVIGLINPPHELSIEAPYYGIICDGVHVAPSMANLAYKSNPEKCILVTDAMHLIGLPNGTYKWDQQTIIKDNDRLYLQGTDTLAGAATTLPQCIRNLVQWSNITLAEAVKTVTNNPSISIGLENERGFLNAGCDADLVVLDKDGYVQKVYKLGNEIESSDVVTQTIVNNEKLLASL